jgi:hypothetical protein
MVKTETKTGLFSLSGNNPACFSAAPRAAASFFAG